MQRLVSEMPVQRATKKECDTRLSITAGKTDRLSKQKKPQDIILNRKQIITSIDVEKERDYLCQNIYKAMANMPPDRD